MTDPGLARPVVSGPPLVSARVTMDFDHFDDPRPRYRLGQVGFGLLGLSLGLLCFELGLFLIRIFGDNQAFGQIFAHPLWNWLIGAPITWGALLGSYMILFVRDTPSWRRRAGSLLALNALDAVLWTISNAQDLGLEVGNPGHDWLRQNLAMATGWMELILTVSLAAEVSQHLGRRAVAESSQVTRMLVIVGATIWGLSFHLRTDWGRWPLAPRNGNHLTLILDLGTLALLSIATFQATTLCVTASRLCRHWIRALDDQESGEDLLRSPSDRDGDAPF